MSTRNTCLIALLGLLGAWGAASAADHEPVVATQSGKVRGSLTDAAQAVAYRGIPYAAPPTGALRWREPQPPLGWSGERAAFTAPGCMQTLAEQLPWTAEFMHHGAVSEDCLYLNVWTPTQAAGKNLPVLVFVHGGGFTQGSIDVPLYDGAALAHHGVIVVTLNYRLGALGFLAHPALTQESAHHASGNYGLMDQLAALRWVHANIAAFGGDPGKITLSGQSAGAISVYLLTAAPQAKGLFQRAIIESGPGALASFGLGGSSGGAQPLAAAQQAGVAFAKSLGAGSAAQLRALDASRLLPAADATGPRFGPVIDGWLLPKDPAEIYAQHGQNDVALLIGMMADEPSAFGGYDAAKATATRAQGLHGVDQVLTDRARTSRLPAFAYYFAHAIPWPAQPQFGAFHSGELPYVFDNLALLDRPWTATDRQLARLASQDWAAFIAHGVPASGWQPYRPGQFNFMVFADSAAMRDLSITP